MINKSNVTLYCHKDIVWFFVVSKQKDKIYLLVYWNIPEKYITSGLTLSQNNINVKIRNLKKINKYFYSCTFSENNVIEIWSFLNYSNIDTLTNWFLTKPYLDNTIWIEVCKRIKKKYPYVQIIQSIDEEKSLIYSHFPENKGISIIIDTIWQDFLQNQIDFDKIYSIISTKYTKDIEKVQGVDIIWLDIDFNFPLEIDKITWNGKKYMLMCPITNWHWPESQVKLSTVERMYLVIESIIEWNRF